MAKQAAHYGEEAGRRLAVLATTAGYVVWAAVALFIVVTVFRIYGTYLDALDRYGP
jgi:hypothetical protein